MPDAASRRVQPRLDLAEADFVALKVAAARQRTTLRTLLTTTITTWLEAGTPTLPALPPLVEPIVRSSATLPEPVHQRLKVRAAQERTTLQHLMRSALA